MGFFSNLTRQQQANDFLDEKIDGAKIEAIYQEISTEETNKRLAVSIAVSYISNAISQCEFKTYENNLSVNKQLYYLLNVAPNKNQNPSEFKNKLVNTILMKQEALVIENNGSFFVADNFTIEKNGMKENTFTNISVGIDNINRRIKANKVFYFKLENENITKLLNSWNRNFEELIDYAYSKFKDRNSNKYILDLQNVKVGDEEFAEAYEKVIKKQLENFIKSRSSVYPQFEGYKLESFDKNNSNGNSIGDVTGLKKEIFDTVAQTFKIPSQMMLGNVSNLSDVVNLFLTFAVDPIAKMIGEEITKKTSTFEEWSKGSFVRVDTSKIQHVDIFANATNIDKLISSGFNSLDEVRENAGQDKLDNDFSRAHWITKNYAKIDDVLNGDTSIKKGGE